MITRACLLLAAFATLARCAGAASLQPVLAGADAATLTVDPRGGIVLLARNRQALIFSHGTEQKLVPLPLADGFEPVAVAAHPKDGVWLAEASGRKARVRLIGTDGKVVATSPTCEAPDAATPSAPALDRAPDGGVLVALGPRVLRLSADLSKVTTAWEAPEHQQDLFAPVGIAALPDGWLAIAERFTAQVWMVDAKGALAWRFGGRGTVSGQLGDVKSITVLPRGEEPVIAVAHTLDRERAISLYDRYGYAHARLDRVPADELRAGTDEVLALDRSARVVVAVRKLDDLLQSSKLYDAWRAAARAHDAAAAEKLIGPWQNAADVLSGMRVAVFRIMWRLGFTGAADAEIERALTELPGRADLLAEAMEHSAATGRVERASKILEKFDWLVNDPMQLDELSSLLVSLRERSVSPR